MIVDSKDWLCPVSYPILLFINDLLFFYADVCEIGSGAHSRAHRQKKGLNKFGEWVMYTLSSDDKLAS